MAQPPARDGLGYLHIGLHTSATECAGTLYLFHVPLLHRHTAGSDALTRVL
jgi:hypothetical protein